MENGKNRMLSDDVIIHPPQIKPSHMIGSIAIMVSNEADLLQLTEYLGWNKSSFRRIYMSRFIASDHPMENFLALGPFIGAPYAVMLLETLIAWGVTKIVFLGWCGSISPDVKIGDIIVPNGAIADEGTSKHYLHSGQFPVSPTIRLTEYLKRVLKDQNFFFHEGIVWTTDGVFRETRDKIIHFQQQHILAVEMELSAVFSVALFRQIEICALVIVSDELSSLQWHPGFTKKRFRDGRKKACKTVVDLCRILSE
jgi:uridine phosphorylase